MKRQLLSSGTRTGRRIGVLVLSLAIATTIAGPVAAANAAATPASSSSSSSTSAGSAASSAQSAKSSSSTAAAQQQAQKPQRLPANAATAQTGTAAKQNAKPVEAAKASAGKVPTAAAQRTARAGAARSLLAHDTVPDTCSGEIAPDTVYPCSSPSSTETDTFTVTLGAAHDLLIFQVLSLSGYALPVSITPPGGTAASCQAPAYYQLPTCATDGAGTYTVQVTSGGNDYTISYLPLLSDGTCAAADPSFADPNPLQGSVPAGSAGACYTLDTPSGHVLHVGSNPNGMTGLVTVYDSTGTQICLDDNGDCPLTGVAPYRVTVNYVNGSAFTYALRAKDVTHPAGCLATAAGAYGVAPDSSSPVLCRALSVTTAGSYQISAFSPTYSGIGGTLYTPAGTSACTNGGPFCQLAAGTYDYVLNEVGTYTDDFGTVFIAADQGQGCTATGDTDFQSGSATGTFAGLGAEACLDLPTASGLSDYVDEQENSDLTVGQVLFVVDATGAQQCANSSFNYLVTCPLSGTAPFRVVLAAGSGNGNGTPDTTYRLLVQRTDSTAGCAAWPQSGFGGSWGATVSLSRLNDYRCVSIPAAQHSTGEMIDYANAANKVDASINVYGPAGGNQVCIGATTAICSYTTGVTYLALVYFAGSPGVTSDTLDLVRRDVSQTASCATPASTAVGGASTTIDLTSDLDAACERVTANAADRLYFQVRTESPYSTGAMLEVADATGKIVCRQWGEIGCPVTGSTSYQAVLIADNYDGVTIAAHLDALRVGTSAGWASQCSAHPLSAEGWAPVSGTLSETAASYCAVVSIQPGQRWEVDGADTATPPGAPQVNMYSTADWTPGDGLCMGRPAASCQASSTDSGQAVLIETLGAVQGSTGFTLQGVCTSECTTQTGFPTMSSVSAASQPQAQANTLVVHGTNLNLGVDLQFLSGGSIYYGVSASAKSVSADGTSLTYSVNSLNAAPGTYDLALSTTGSPFCPGPGQPSAQCLYGGYTVTANPAGADSTFTAVAASRILDTRKGLGAPQKQIAAYGTLPLTVSGVDGVPKTGVTAVVLDLTAVNEAAGGNLVAYGHGTTRPVISDLDFVKGRIATNLATVPVSQGAIDLYNYSGGAIDLVADLAGYYTSGTAGSLYTALTPARVLDTSTGIGAAKAQIKAGGTLPVTVAGAGGLPGTGVTAVALNLTASDPTGGGSLTVYPYGAARPLATALTFAAAQPTTSLVVVPVVQGKIDLYNAAGTPVDLAADVEGYYSASGSGFRPLEERVMDTRSLLGGAGGTVPSHGVALLPAGALTGVPGAATSVVLDVQVVGAQQSGTLTVFRDGTALPGLSDLAYQPGVGVSGQIVVPAGATLDFYDGSGGTIQILANVEGYFTS